MEAAVDSAPAALALEGSAKGFGKGPGSEPGTDVAAASGTAATGAPEATDVDAADGGPANTDNGVRLCTHHHLHKEHWQIHIKTGIPWFTPPPHINPPPKTPLPPPPDIQTAQKNLHTNGAKFRSTIQGNPAFVDPGLKRHAADGPGGNVGRVDGQDVRLSPKPARQGGVQIPFINIAASGKNIAPGTPHCSGVNIGGVQLDSRRKPCQCQPHRPGSAAKVHY